MNYKFENDIYHIQTTKLDAKEGVEQAMNTLIEVASDFIENRDDYDHFACEFYENGELIKEEIDSNSNFWNKVVQVESAHDSIINYLTHVIAIVKKTGNDYFESDEYAIGEKAVYQLALANKIFLPFYTKFMYIWDLSHEVYQAEEVIELVHKYGWCKETQDLLIARTSCEGQHDYECLESCEELIEENIGDLSSSEFFKTMVINSYDGCKDYAEWESFLDYTFLPFMRDAAVKLMKKHLGLTEKV